MSVTVLVATYLVYMLKAGYRKAFRGDFNKLNVEFFKNTCSKVMATFADHIGLLGFLRWTKWAAMTSFQVCRSSDNIYNPTDSSFFVDCG